MRAEYDTLVLTLAAALVAVSLVGGTCEARAQDRADEALLLARLCANEAGLPLSDDCAAIDHVLRVRASVSGRTYADVLHRYQRNAGALGLDRTDSRRWIAFLSPDGAEPPGWQPRLRWSRHRPRWLALYEQAQAIRAGEVPSPCDVEPDHWGAPGYLDRPRRAGWSRVDCGATRNAFWRMPANAPARRQGAATGVLVGTRRQAPETARPEGSLPSGEP